MIPVTVVKGLDCVHDYVLGESTGVLGTASADCSEGGSDGSSCAPVGGEVRDGIAAVRQAQAGADQAVEGLLELAVGHARAPKGDAPHVRVRVLNC